LNFVGRQDAEKREEKPDAAKGSRERKTRRPADGAPAPPAERDLPLPQMTELMEAVVERENMVRALRRVAANKGAAGVDEMSVQALKGYLKEQWPGIKEQLLAGTYQPQPVRGVEIPKPGGKGTRQLGIPTVVDRLIQQAIHQALQPIFEEEFSESSYGFRPGRCAHQAVLKAREYVASGRRWVVDIDLEKFFDRVNHDVLMARVARKVSDKRLLGLIRRYLEAGIMREGVVSARTEGTPQGGPLSPLLSNILLDDLDKELERRGHAFCRYADDCNMYVRSQRAGERVMASVTRYLAKRLKLKVNCDKSAVERPWKRKFLGYGMTRHRQPRIAIAAASVERFKAKARERFHEGRGRSLSWIIAELGPMVRGWVNYFRLAEVKGVLEDLDEWLRHKLRALVWRQWKRPYTRARNLMKRGVEKVRAWQSATNGHGPWYNGGAAHMHQAFPTRLFTQLGLVSLLAQHRRLQATA